jgi:Mlc titration factor MtfA (ptsG expression regulator)
MRWPWTRKKESVDLGFIENAIATNVGLVASLDADQRRRHLALTSELMADKRWEAAAGFSLTDEMIVTVAANATIPILGLDLWVYRQVNSIILHPTTTTTSGRRSGPAAGVVSDAEVHIVGLASPNSGPVSLSWDTALSGSRSPQHGHNVIIHEFAHKIDMSDGATDGVPPLRGPGLRQWEAMLSDEYEHSKTQKSDHVLRPYAWTNRAEFFAVATEAFFCQPRALRAAKPNLYECMSDFYVQDPAAARG